MKQYLKQKNRSSYALLIMVSGLIILGVISLFSIVLGAKQMTLSQIISSLLHYDPQNSLHIILYDLRLPRMIAAVFIGICFSLSGAVMQAVTRNPLADSGLLGINAGASFLLALCFSFFPGASHALLLAGSFLGAALAAVLVYFIGSRSASGLTPVRLVLAGTAISALLSSLSMGIAMYYHVAQDLSFWTAGGLSRITWSQIAFAAPFILLCIFISLLLSNYLTLLSLGEDISTGLGVPVKFIQTVSFIIVTLSSATAVSIAGSIGFIGLIIPHAVRAVIGSDYRYLLPASMIYGAAFSVLCDLLSRILHPPGEVPLGAIIALIGVPFFLYLARKELHDL